MEPSTTTTTTQGPCNNTCPVPDWRDPPVLDPWTTTTTTSGGGTTTTTTSAPCSGTCRFTWSVGSRTWVKSSSTCSTGCACLPPTFCPPDPNSPVCTDTYCYRNPYDSPLPNCTGTTTSYGPEDCTTTTTTLPGCRRGNCSGCDWECDPIRKRWISISGECDGCRVGCDDFCPAPSTPCDNECITAHTDCLPVLPPPPVVRYCTRTCRFYWLPAPDNSWHTHPNSEICQSAGIVLGETCSCQPPQFDGTTCGTEVYTPCVIRGTPLTTTTLGPGDCVVTPVLTTPPYDPSNPCAGSCYWRADGVGGWLFVSGCPSCTCSPPEEVSSSPCGMAQTPCGVPTTTTTTIPPLTTTTTTPNPCGTTQCVWSCDGSAWNLVSNPCNTGCGCVYPTAPCTFSERGAGIGTSCIIDGTTTTTTVPPTNCNCQYDPTPQYPYKACSGGMPGSGFHIRVTGVISLDPRCQLLSDGWNCSTQSGDCGYSGDAVGGMTGSVTYGLDGGGNAVKLGYIYDPSDDSQISFRDSSAPPIDCCSTTTISYLDFSGFSECGGLTGSGLEVTPLSACDCSTTTTTTIPPSTTTTTTLPPGTLQYYCVDETSCSMIGCTTCAGSSTRSCQGWYSTPPACTDSGMGSVRRVVYAGPFLSSIACSEACVGTPTTTTASPGYKCYSCPPEGGGVGVGTCIQNGDPVPSGCIGPLSSWSTFLACSTGCVGGIVP